MGKVYNFTRKSDTLKSSVIQFREVPSTQKTRKPPWTRKPWEKKNMRSKVGSLNGEDTQENIGLEWWVWWMER